MVKSKYTVTVITVAGKFSSGKMILDEDEFETLDNAIKAVDKLEYFWFNDKNGDVLSFNTKHIITICLKKTKYIWD